MGWAGGGAVVYRDNGWRTVKTTLLWLLTSALGIQVWSSLAIACGSGYPSLPRSRLRCVPEFSPAPYSALPFRVLLGRYVSGQKGGFDSLGSSPFYLYLFYLSTPLSFSFSSPSPISNLTLLTLPFPFPTLQSNRRYLCTSTLRYSASFCGIPPSYRPQLRGAEKAASDTEYAWAFRWCCFQLVLPFTGWSPIG